MFDIDKSLKNMLGKQKNKVSTNYFDVNKILKKPKYPKKQDWDMDGVPNWKDCQPRNIMRQDKSEVDYVKAGLKPVAHVITNEDIQYAKSLGLVVTLLGENNGYITRTKNEPQLKKLLNINANTPASVNMVTSGRAFGYPEKAVQGEQKKQINVFQPRIDYEMQGKETKDLDYLEYIPYNMTFEEAQKDALRRKKATTHNAPLRATHVVKWMTEQKRLNPNLTYEELEDAWMNLPTNEREEMKRKYY